MELFCSQALDVIDRCDQSVLSKAIKCHAESEISIKTALERFNIDGVCRNLHSGKECSKEFTNICPANKPVYHLYETVSQVKLLYKRHNNLIASIMSSIFDFRRSMTLKKK